MFDRARLAAISAACCMCTACNHALQVVVVTLTNQSTMLTKQVVSLRHVIASLQFSLPFHQF
jgi:hypothetical protein